MLRGAFFHDFEDFHIHDDHADDHAGAGGGGGPDGGDGVDGDGFDVTWALDNVELTTVGVDVGSSTSHLLFAQRASSSPKPGDILRRRDGIMMAGPWQVLGRAVFLSWVMPSDAGWLSACERVVFSAGYGNSGLTSS